MKKRINNFIQKNFPYRHLEVGNCRLVEVSRKNDLENSYKQERDKKMDLDFLWNVSQMFGSYPEIILANIFW